MYVLHAWKSSLQLFKPSNFKLFLLVTLKSLKSTYQKYLKYGWPFLLFIVLSMGVVYKFQEVYYTIIEAIQQGLRTTADVAWIFGMCGYMLLLALAVNFCTFLVSIFARPSVDQKNYAYMRSYIKKYFVWYVLQSLLYIFMFQFFYQLCIYWVAKVGLDYFYLVRMVLLGRYMYVANVFSVLFLLDLGGGFKSFIKSIWFGIKMTFYNLPFVLIVVVVLYMSTRFVNTSFIIEPFIYPLWFCFIANYYTKKVHDQARLYQGS